MAEATSEKLVGTIGIRVSETTDRELDTLIEKLEDVNSVADTLVKKTLTLDIKTDTIESKIASVSKGLNKELREQLVGGFRTALDEMKTSLKEADVSFKVSFDVAEFSAQLTQAVTAAASITKNFFITSMKYRYKMLNDPTEFIVSVSSKKQHLHIDIVKTYREEDGKMIIWPFPKELQDSIVKSFQEKGKEVYQRLREAQAAAAQRN